MTEQAPQLNHEIDKRPLGRFLLSEPAVVTRERIWHRGAYSYIRNFVAEYTDQLHKSGPSFIAAAEIDDDGSVSIPSNTPSFDRAVWLELEQHDSIGYTWRIRTGRDEYYMDLAERAYTVTKYELNTMGSVLRRTAVDDQDLIENLQLLVETMITNCAIDEKVASHRQAMADDLRKYLMLEGSSGLTLKQQKEKASLRKTANESYFRPGSIGPRHKRPLY